MVYYCGIYCVFAVTAAAAAAAPCCMFVFSCAFRPWYFLPTRATASAVGSSLGALGYVVARLLREDLMGRHSRGEASEGLLVEQLALHQHLPLLLLFVLSLVFITTSTS